MIETDVIIVGGGPGGSACAWRLRQNNIHCLILDSQRFPRFKPCAGWITPEIVKEIDLANAGYPYGFSTYTSSTVYIRGLKLKLPSYQHAIRRYEFDDWLLKRAGAPVYEHAVKAITRDGDSYVVDGEYCARYLVGAGGTHCPVYRTLFKPDGPRAKEKLVVAQEEEFPYPYTDAALRLWFFENHLPGYAWYVPKVNGYLNVGVGGFEEKLKANGDSLKNHWNHLVEKLERMGLVRDHEYKPSGHSYFVRQRLPEIRRENAFLVGDAAGLATLDLGEGISPAIRSGLLAAEAIAHGTDYSVDSIPKYSQPFPVGRLLASTFS